MSDPEKTDGAAKNGRRLGDWSSWSAALLLLLLLPASVMCCALLLLPLRLIWDDVNWMIVVYFAVGALLLIPGVDHVFWRWHARGTREPDADERIRLKQAWSEVMRRSGRTDGNSYRLLVIDTDNVNAMAGGARHVFVTTAALDVLDDDVLPGVLAHELGHHVGLHPIVLALEIWFMQPILWALNAAVGLSNVFASIAEGFSGIVRIIATLITLAFRALAGVLMAVSWIAFTVLRFTGRGAEYRADRFAAEIGLGAELSVLLEALARLEDEGAISHDRSLVDVISSTHPPAVKRLRRVQRHMQ